MFIGRSPPSFIDCRDMVSHGTKMNRLCLKGEDYLSDLVHDCRNCLKVGVKNTLESLSSPNLRFNLQKSKKLLHKSVSW